MPRLTVAQALVRFLSVQHVERDGVRGRFFDGCLGIFGHGNVAGLGEALLSGGEQMPYYLARNEQGMVHTAAGYARERRRLATLVCTTSIGPGATNLVTGAAAATVNRLPVLLLPGDVFATRGPHPVLQQLEHPGAGDVTVNDCLRPVSRWFDRVQRPEQLASAALEATRVLTDPAETGAVTICLPQDVQTEAHEFPEDLFAPRTWTVRRAAPEAGALAEAATLIRAARRPLIVAGGGVVYSEASAALSELSARTGIPVAETQAGKGSLPWQEPGALGAVGATGTLAANRIAAQADVVIGVGTRWSDFTTASKTAFANPQVRFVNINVAGVDLAKHSALAVQADARAALEALEAALEGFRVAPSYLREVHDLREGWEVEVARLYGTSNPGPLPAQAEIVGAVEEAAEPEDVIVAAAGSLPGDLHKLWRARRPGSYHVEYGYSTMGYEIAGALGVKMAAPEREVFALLGDGSWLMLSSELVTAVQEGVKVIVVLIDNHGFASIGALSRSVGTGGFGTRYRRRSGGSLSLDGDGEKAELLPVDLAANAESLGAEVIRAADIDELRLALKRARAASGPVVIAIGSDRFAETPSYESWWDVPVAEVSEREEVRAAREHYVAERERRRDHLRPARPAPGAGTERRPAP